MGVCVSLETVAKASLLCFSPSWNVAFSLTGPALQKNHTVSTSTIVSHSLKSAEPLDPPAFTKKLTLLSSIS